MEEREIDLISLLFHILLHWRSLIVAGLIAAILAGGYGFVSVSDKNDVTAGAERQDTEDGDVDVYLRTMNSYDDMLAYLDSLEYMKLDGENVAKTVVKVVVKGDKKEITDDIAAVYCMDIKDGGYWDYVNGKSSLSAADIELFVTAVSEYSAFPAQMYDPSDEPMGHKCSTITVTAIGRTEEEAEELADMAVDFFNAEKASVAKDLGAHELMVLSKNTRTGYDISVMTAQNDKLTALYKLYDEMVKRKKVLTEDQLKALLPDNDGEAVNVNPVQASGMSAGAKLRSCLKYILIGLCGGVFCMAGMWAFLYVINNRIKTEDPIEKLFGVAVIGVVPAAYEKKRVFGFVDRWIISIRDRNKRIFSVDEAVSLVISRVKVQSSKDKVSKLVFIGCDLGKNVPSIPESMADKLNSDSINASVLDNVLYDPENTEKLAEMDGAVIIEKAGRTLYTKLTDEIELLKRQQIKLLGCVIVE